MRNYNQSSAERTKKSKKSIRYSLEDWDLLIEKITRKKRKKKEKRIESRKGRSKSRNRKQKEKRKRKRTKKEKKHCGMKEIKKKFMPESEIDGEKLTSR